MDRSRGAEKLSLAVKKGLICPIPFGLETPLKIELLYPIALEIVELKKIGNSNL